MTFRFAVVAILAVSILGGCFGGNGEQGQHEPQDPESGSTSHSSTGTSDACESRPDQSQCRPTNTTGFHLVEMLDCETYITSVAADATKVATHLPDGYAMADQPVEVLFLDSHVCKSAVIDNATVVPDFHIFFVGLQVEVPQEVASEGRDSYIFELCTNNPIVRGFLEEAGFVVCEGSIAVSRSGQLLNVVYTVSGNPVYDVSAVVVDQDGTYFPGSGRHHQGNFGQFAYHEWRGESATVGFGAGQESVSGGFIGEVMLAPGEAPTDFGINLGDFLFEIPLLPTTPE